MRLWSLYPGYLDKSGLLGLWRESLLAQKVLLGQTKGYKNHPQLKRFKETEDPVANIGAYLIDIFFEGKSRGYNFSVEKIYKPIPVENRIFVTVDQVHFEILHLRKKLKERKREGRLELQYPVRVHNLFELVEGPVEPWEKGRV